MIQFDSLRKDIDPPFLAAANELSDAYYKFWKRGESSPWQGFDVRATLELSKALFDKLHGALWNAHALAIHDANVARGFPYDTEKTDPLDDRTSVRRSVQIKARLAYLRSEGINMQAILATRGVTVAVD